MKRRGFLKTVGAVTAGVWTKNVHAQPTIGEVTDPDKVVTDPVVLNHLLMGGIDYKYVELFGDYKRGDIITPYCKFYRDLLSNKEIMVSSGLPMRSKDNGLMLDPSWFLSGSEYHNKVNLFDAVVDGTQIYVEALNDQPYGRAKSGDSITWNPRLFVGGIERLPISLEPTLLAFDPINPDAEQSTLEWDYGVCKRRLRLIQGKIKGYWVFHEDPGGDIRIVYNSSGGLKLKLGNATDISGMLVIISVMNGDEEFIPANKLSDVGYPLSIGDSTDFYPDADVESTSVDGNAVHEDLGGLSWATLLGSAGTAAFPSLDNGSLGVRIIGHADADKWTQMQRGIFLFDTSSLGEAAIVSAATFSLYGTAKGDVGGITPGMNVYSSNPTDNDDIVPADYATARYGTTELATATITYANWTALQYNVFTLNASGIAAIDTIGVSKFATRNPDYDVPGTPPAHAEGLSYLRGNFADEGSNKPKLSVTYTPGWLGTLDGVFPLAKVDGIESPEKIDGI